MKKILLLILAAAVCGAPILSAAEVLPQIAIQNLRSKAMGGARLAILDDQYAMMNNPAGPSVLRYKNGEHSYRNRWLSLIQAQGVIAGDFLSFWENKDALIEAAGSIADGVTLENDLYNYLSGLRLAAGTTPLFFSMQNILPLHLSLAVFDSLNMRVKTNPDGPLPTWDILAYNDTVAVLNFAYKLPEIELGVFKERGNILELSFGANAKVIQRMQIGKNGAEISDLVDLSDLNMKKLDFRRGMAFGMDLGIVAAFHLNVDGADWYTQKRDKPDLTLSLVCTDFYKTRFSWTRPNSYDSLGDILFGDGESIDGPAGEGVIKPGLGIGVAWWIGTIIPFVLDDIILTFDVRDIFSSASTTFLKIYAGFEFSVIKAFKLRGGIYQGYLSGGLGIDVPVLPIEIDFAYWGEEMGLYPGQERLDNFGATLNLVF